MEKRTPLTADKKETNITTPSQGILYEINKIRILIFFFQSIIVLLEQRVRRKNMIRIKTKGLALASFFENS